ncbi:serine hydrolase [Amycolatopsis pittospori]|uniref:serine hydrolase n=1 Tax=Amycolatopsis pittospori TaxID=2749434 RepID=UPI0015F002C5|nr:serine hydrolase [Amycolatopsis pittospori]
MGKVSGVFLLVGLCLGAIMAMLLIPPARSDTTVVADAASGAAAMSVEPEASEPRASTEPSPPPSPSPSPSKSAVPGKPPIDAKALAELNPGGQVSVIVYDRTTKKNTVSLQPDRSYTSASLVKILIALQALQDGAPPGTVQRMLSASDDNIASALWSAHGGAAIVTRWATKIGLGGTRPPEDPGRWGDTRITAADIAKIYRYLLDQAGSGTRTIMRALSGATESGADGIRQYFGIPDGVGELPWSIKQGWSCCRGARILHTSGVVGKDDRYVVVVLTSQPTSTTYASGGKRVTEVVKALVPSLTTP